MNYIVVPSHCHYNAFMLYMAVYNGLALYIRLINISQSTHMSDNGSNFTANLLLSQLIVKAKHISKTSKHLISFPQSPKTWDKMKQWSIIITNSVRNTHNRHPKAHLWGGICRAFRYLCSKFSVVCYICNYNISIKNAYNSKYIVIPS